MLWNYIHENNFRVFSMHENILTMKIKRIMVLLICFPTKELQTFFPQDVLALLSLDLMRINNIDECTLIGIYKLECQII